MKMPARLPLVLLLGMAAQACAGAPPAASPASPGAAPPKAASPRAEATRTPAAIAAKATLSGTVAAPPSLVAGGVGQLIGTDGSSLIGTDGASLIGTDGSSLIGTDGASLAGRAVLAAGDRPVAGAQIVLTDGFGRPAPGVKAVVTGPDGRWTLEGVPTTGVWVVHAGVKAASGKATTLMSFVEPGAATAPAAISAETTLASSGLLGRRGRQAAGFDAGAYARIVGAVGRLLEAEALPDLADRRGVAAWMERRAAADADLAKAVLLLDARMNALEARVGDQDAQIAELQAQLAAMKQRLDSQATPAPSPTPTAAPTYAPEPGGEAEDETPFARMRVLTQVGGQEPWNGRPMLARSLALKAPFGLYGDGGVGGYHVSDQDAHRIYHIVEGRAELAAGTGEAGFSGDGGPAVEARFNAPQHLLRGPDRALYVADNLNYRIRRIGRDGVVNTVVGADVGAPLPADGADALEVHVGTIGQMAWNLAGELVFAAKDLGLILRLDAAGKLHVVAGGGVGPQGVALEHPIGVACAADGTTWISEYLGHRIRRIAPDGTLTTVAGTGAAGAAVAGPAAGATLNGPAAIVLDSAGDLVFSEFNQHRVWKLTREGRLAPVTAGADGQDVDGRPAAETRVAAAQGLMVGGRGGLLIAETLGKRVRRLDPDSI